MRLLTARLLKGFGPGERTGTAAGVLAHVARDLRRGRLRATFGPKYLDDSHRSCHEVIGPLPAHTLCCSCSVTVFEVIRFFMIRKLPH